MDTMNDGEEWSLQEHMKLLRGEIDNCDIDHGTPLDIPEWFDPVKYERGQKFFRKNYFALFVSKLAGLFAILTIPEIYTILILTHRSSTPASSFKRYLATIAHMLLWYEHPMNVDSWTWKSLRDILHFHKSANETAKAAKKGKVSQASLAITQFGFMGYGLTKAHLLGINDSDKEDIDGFVHFWRVIGHMIGIQDRYNICRSNIEETRQLCQEILDQLIAPRIETPEKEFLDLSKTMLIGSWAISPMVDEEGFAKYVHHISGIEVTKFSNWYSRYLYYYQIFVHEYVMPIRFIGDLVRIVLNYLLMVGMTLTIKYPLLGHYAFGIPLRSRVVSYE